MKIMHLLAAGGTGGIETLCKNYAMYSAHDNTFVIIWGKDGDTYLEMRKNGADVIQLNASKKRPLQTLRRIDAIRRERKIDTVVVHHGAPLSHLYLVLVKKKAGNHIWTITYAHGNAEVIYRIHDRRWRFLRKRVLKYTLQNTDQIVAISQSVKESLVKYLNASEKKICVVYNGVDTKKFNHADLHPFSYPRRLIYVGRLVREKGVQITLKALAGLPEKLEWRFQIIGDGPFRKELEHMAAELNLQGKVQFLGIRSDIPRLLEKADIFIHMPVLKNILNSVHSKRSINYNFFNIFGTGFTYNSIEQILITINKIWRSHSFCCSNYVVPFFKQNFQIFLNISF